MDENAKSSQTDMQAYTQARQARAQDRKQYVLDVALDLFLRNGLSRVAVTDIMEEAMVSKTTMYRYFESFDEIAFEVEKKMMGRIFSSLTDVLNQGITDIEELACAVQLVLIENFYENIDAYKYTGMFDNMYSEYYPSTKFAQEQVDMINNSFVARKIMIRAGVPEDTHNKIVTSTNVVMSFLYRLASRGKLIEKHQSISVDAQIEEFKKMIKRTYQ